MRAFLRNAPDIWRKAYAFYGDKWNTVKTLETYTSFKKRLSFFYKNDPPYEHVYTHENFRAFENIFNISKYVYS